jgi:putative transposase
MMDEIFRRRRLPHWDVAGAIYFVTACLDGSIPAQGLSELAAYRNQLARRPIPFGLSRDEWQRRQWQLVFAQADDWLDSRPAARHLEDPALATIVEDTLYFFAGQRYELIAYVVMPSHFHWVFRPTDA